MSLLNKIFTFKNKQTNREKKKKNNPGFKMAKSEQFFSFFLSRLQAPGYFSSTFLPLCSLFQQLVFTFHSFPHLPWAPGEGLMKKEKSQNLGFVQQK